MSELPFVLRKLLFTVFCCRKHLFLLFYPLLHVDRWGFSPEMWNQESSNRVLRNVKMSFTSHTGIFPDALMFSTEGEDPQHWKNLQPASQSEYRAFPTCYWWGASAQQHRDGHPPTPTVHMCCPLNRDTQCQSVLFLLMGISFTCFKLFGKRAMHLCNSTSVIRSREWVWKSKTQQHLREQCQCDPIKSHQSGYNTKFTQTSFTFMTPQTLPWVYGV